MNRTFSYPTTSDYIKTVCYFLLAPIIVILIFGLSNGAVAAGNMVILILFFLFLTIFMLILMVLKPRQVTFSDTGIVYKNGNKESILYDYASIQKFRFFFNNFGYGFSTSPGSLYLYNDGKEDRVIKGIPRNKKVLSEITQIIKEHNPGSIQV